MANTQLHLHTAHSLNDGTIEASALVARLKEMGATACAVTDHGTLMAVEEFTAAFEKAGLKLIPGVEAYVDTGKGQREHLVLLSADQIGYKAICRAVTESNSNIDAKGFPLMTIEMLERWFGEGTDGHGHVIATSACIQGVIACELRHNDYLEKTAERHEAKMEKVGFDVEAYNSLLQTLKKEEEKLEAVKEQRRELSSLKDKPFKKKIKELERSLTLIGEEEYAKRKADLEAEMEASREAAKSFILVKAEEKLQSKTCTGIRESVRKLSSKSERYEQEKANAAEIRAQKLPESVLFENAVQKAEAFKRIFGEGNFYGEIQYHGIPDEARIYPLIVQVAKKCGLPLVATNDAHIPSNTEDERRRRQYLRSLRFNKWEEESVGDDQLYVKTDEELKEILIQILPEEVVDRAIQTNQEVADRCNVLMEKGEHYPKYPCKEGETPESIMRALLNKGWKEKLGFKKSHPLYQLYHDRVEYELEVIKKLNVLDYHLIVQDFLEYGRLLGKIDLTDPRYLADPYNKELLRELADGRVGFGIGIGRGSAVGSLVCYLIGITGADPIKYNLLFERFLNTERVTMPDIDSDLSPAIRDKVIDYVKNKYGEAGVCSIMTSGVQAAKGAIRNCARLISEHELGDKARLYDMADSLCDILRELPDESLSNPETFQALVDKINEGGCGKIRDGEIEPPCSEKEYALRIIHDAQLMEGSKTTLGVHAAGVIIADNGDVGEYIPLMKSKEGLWVSQCDMGYTENKGLLKMDVRLVR